MISYVRTKKEDIEIIARATARDIFSLMQYNSNEELTDSFYIFSKEFEDKFTYEMSKLLVKKRSEKGYMDGR